MCDKKAATHDSVINSESERVLREILGLEQEFPLEYNLDEGWFEIEIEFPPGWSPRQGVLRFELPKDYRKTAPAVYIPDSFEYEGYEGELPPCVWWDKKSDWLRLTLPEGDWDPETHTVRTWYRMALLLLKEPTRSGQPSREVG